MLEQLLYIDWNVTPELIPGRSTPNKYGLLFVSGIILGYYVIKRMFKEDKIEDSYLDKLLMYIVIATVIGARLGHVFFYDWDYYKDHLSEIPQVWQGGLASHGAAIAILATLYFYAKYVIKKPFLWILDRVVIPITIAGCFIRLGNLMNSEIIGKPSDLPWAFMFHLSPEAVDPMTGKVIPRHPTQLYEAIYYFLTFIVLMFLYWKKNWRKHQGAIFGIFMILLWSGRFVMEFTKYAQTDRDFDATISTGQWLSVPFILVGIWVLYRSKKQSQTT